MQRKLTRTALLAIALASASIVARGEQHGCEVENIFVALDPSAPFSIEDFGFRTGSIGSSAHLTFVYKGTKPLAQLLLLMDFVDTSGKRLSTIPFYAATAGRLADPYHLFLLDRTQLPQNIRSGSKIVLSGDRYATSLCPSTARLSLAELIFADNTGYHKSSGWELDPSIKRARSMDLKTFPESLPRQEIIRVAIDGQGQPTVLSEGASKEWFARQLRRWSFAPAVRDGAAVPGELTLVFELQADNSSATSEPRVSLADKATYIKVVPAPGPGADGKQTILAGGFPLLLPADRE